MRHQSRLNRRVVSGAKGALLLVGTVLCWGCATSGHGEPVYSAPADAIDAFAIGAARPPSVKTLYRLGKLLAAQGRMVESSASFRACIARYPRFMPAYCQLAGLSVRHRQFDTAIETLQRGLNVAPDDPVLRNDLGMCLLLRGQPEAALNEFAKAAAIVPNDPRYRANVALATGVLGRYDEAFKLYCELLGNGGAHFNLGVICQARGDVERAALEFAKANSAGTTAGEKAGDELRLVRERPQDQDPGASDVPDPLKDGTGEIFSEIRTRTGAGL